MRHGCWRGEPFEGSDPRRGEDVLRSTVHRASARCDGGSRSTETRRTPDWKRGATNPQPWCGESRRGGAKPRGRNESWRVETPARRSASALPEWTQQVNRWRGESGKDHERRNPRSGSPDCEGFSERTSALKERPRSRGSAHPVLPDERDHLGNTSRAGPATVQGRGGSREVQRPATRIDRRNRTITHP